jgi:hypothetical protein
MMLGLIASSVLCTGAYAHYHSSSTDSFIYDDNDRVSFFHGTNFVQKGFPWYPEVLLNSDNIKGILTFYIFRCAFVLIYCINNAQK